MDDITERIDGRCQMCGTPCDAEFCGDGHWQLWMASRLSNYALAEVTRHLTTAAEAMAPVLAQLGASMEQVRQVCIQAGIVPETPPADPRAAALHARRHRNTGPTVHADPRRNRRRGR